MAYGDSTEIVSGAGKIYVATTATTVAPITANAVDSLDSSTTWLQLGYTQDGITLAVDTEITEVPVDQEDGPVAVNIQKQTGKISCTLAETDLENLARCIPGATYTASTSIGTNPNQLGVGGGTLSFVSVAVVGNAPGSSKETLYFFSRCQPTSSISLALKKGENHQVPVEFVALSNNSMSAGSRLMSAYEET